MHLVCLKVTKRFLLFKTLQNSYLDIVIIAFNYLIKFMYIALLKHSLILADDHRVKLLRKRSSKSDFINAVYIKVRQK